MGSALSGNASLSNVSGLLKNDYLPEIRVQSGMKTVLLDNVEKNTKDIDGKSGIMNLHISGNQGTGARKENQALPTKGYQVTKQATIPLKYLYGVGQITGQTMRLAKSKNVSFANALTFEMQSLIKDLRKHSNILLYGDGSGARAVLASATVTTPLTLNPLYWNPKKVFSDNMELQIFDNSQASSSADLTPLDSATPDCLQNGDLSNAATLFGNWSLEFDGAGAFDDFVPATGDLVGKFGELMDPTGTNDGGTFKCPYGVRVLVDDDNMPGDANYWNTQMGSSGPNGDYTLFGVDINSYATWKSVVKEGSSPRTTGSGDPTLRAVTEELMQEIEDEIEENDGDTSFIITTSGIRRSYGTLLKGDRRFMNFYDNVKGGYKGLDFNGKAVLKDKHATLTDMYFLDKKRFELFVGTDWEFVADDGSELYRIQGYDAFGFDLVKYMNLGVDKRNAQGRLTDLSGDSL